MSTVICPGCKEEINASVKSCPYCGKQIEGDLRDDPEPVPPPHKNRIIKRVVKGILVLILLWFVLSVIVVQFGQYKPRAYNSDAKSNLHNLYLGCKAYWAEHGSEQECDVSKVATQEYGFIQSSRVTIAGHGTEMNFTATAQHMDSTTQYTMDVNGSIE